MPAGDGDALFVPARASSRTRLPVDMQSACQLTSSMHVNQHACQDEAEWTSREAKRGRVNRLGGAMKTQLLSPPVAIAHTICMPTACGRYVQICIEKSTAHRGSVGAANDRRPADHREGREFPSPASSWLIAAMPCSRAAIGAGEFAITSAASSTAANRT